MTEVNSYQCECSDEYCKRRILLTEKEYLSLICCKDGFTHYIRHPDCIDHLGVVEEVTPRYKLVRGYHIEGVI